MGKLHKLKKEIKKGLEKLEREMYEDEFLLYIDEKTFCFFTRGSKILIFNTSFYEIFPNEVSVRGEIEEISVENFIERYVKNEAFARKILKKIGEKLKEYESVS